MLQAGRSLVIVYRWTITRSGTRTRIGHFVSQTTRLIHPEVSSTRSMHIPAGILLPPYNTLIVPVSYVVLGGHEEIAS